MKQKRKRMVKIQGSPEGPRVRTLSRSKRNQALHRTGSKASSLLVNSRIQDIHVYLLVRPNEGMSGVFTHGGMPQAAHGGVAGCRVGQGFSREAVKSIGKSWDGVPQTWERTKTDSQSISLVQKKELTAFSQRAGLFTALPKSESAGLGKTKTNQRVTTWLTTRGVFFFFCCRFLGNKTPHRRQVGP